LGLRGGVVFPQVLGVVAGYWVFRLPVLYNGLSLTGVVLAIGSTYL